MTEKNVSCPSCHNVDPKRLGPLPVAYHFCALTFDHPINKGELMQCSVCSLAFRHPCISRLELHELYSKQPALLWSSTESSTEARHDFQKISECLAAGGLQINDVLDVGCYTGSLLRFLKENCPLVRNATLHGIEPSSQAAAVASSHGIEIVGTSVEEFIASANRYDLILMTDVFEHILECTDNLGKLAGCLRPHARLIVVTGAYDSGPFSFWANRYYYAAMPEHLAFISKKYAQWCANNLGLSLLAYQVIENRGSTTLRATTKALLKGGCYLLFSLLPERFFRLGPQRWTRKLRAIRGYGMPNVLSRPDHALVVFEAPG